MFDIGGSELLVIGVVALIVIGPKDLPQVFRALGQFTAKARGMAREFQRAMEDAADQTGAGDLTRELRAINSVKNFGLGTMDEAVKRLETWNDNKLGEEDGLQPDPDAPRGPATEELTRQRAAKAEALNEKFGGTDPAGVAEGITPEGQAPAPKKTRKAASAATGKSGAKTGTSKTGTSKTGTAKAAGSKSAAAKTTGAKSASAKTTGAKASSAKTTGAKASSAKGGPRGTASKSASTDVAASAVAKPARTRPAGAKTPGAAKASPRKTAAAKATGTGATSATTKTASRTTTAKGTAAKSRKTPNQSDA